MRSARISPRARICWGCTNAWRIILAHLVRARSSVKRMAPFWRKGEIRSELALTMYVFTRAKMQRSTHGLGPRMNLPFDQDDVSIHVVIVIPETSYRRARRDLFDGT